MAKNQTATARVMDEKRTPAPKQEALRAGHVQMTPKALVALFVTSDQLDKDRTRLAQFTRMIQQSTQDHVKESLRGQNRTERAAGKQAPFIQEALEQGFTLSTAKARLAEMGTLWKAHLSGNFDLAAQQAWHKAVAAARERLNGVQRQRKAQSVVKFNTQAEALLLAGMDTSKPLSQKQKLDLFEKREELAAKLRAESMVESEAKRIDGAAKRIYERARDSAQEAGASPEQAEQHAAEHCKAMAAALTIVAETGVTATTDDRTTAQVTTRTGLAPAEMADQEAANA